MVPAGGGVVPRRAAAEAASGTEVVPVGGAPNVSHASSRSPGNCAGVIGRPDGVTGPPSPASPSSRALRRQRGPTHSSRCSSSSSQAACADGGRPAGVLASSPSTQAAIGAGTSGAISASGTGGSWQCASRIAIGSRLPNGTEPENSS